MISIALGTVLFTSTGHVHAKKKTPFQSYLQKSFYVKKLKDVASKHAMANADECPIRNTTFARKRYDVIQQPVFKKRRLHPFEGIWIEKVNVFVCGKSHALDITLVANPDGLLPKFDVSPSKALKIKQHEKPQNPYGEYDFN